MKLKKGDEVKIIRGKDKGKTGIIDKIIGKDKVLIPNVNQYKRHLKRGAKRQKSDIVTIAKPISAYSVSLICPGCGKTTRVGFKTVGTEKSRVCKKCKEAIKT